jgi:hypothetical protein
MAKSYPEMNKKEQREEDARARRYSENETAGIPQPLRKPVYRPKKSTGKRRMERA